MSEHENELTKALAENGSLDAEKARRDAAEATSCFDARLRRDARILWFSVIVVIAVFEIAFVGLYFASGTKSTVAFGVLIVVTLVLILVMSIQNSITNTKTRVPREINLLRFERLGLPVDRAIATARIAAGIGTSVWHVLPLRENLTWLSALILVALFSNQITFRLVDWGMMQIESQVTLLPDGSGSSVRKVSSRYQGAWPMTSIALWSSDPSCKFTHWLDGQGRELPVSVSGEGTNRKVTAQFIEPVMPGEWFTYTTTVERLNMATKQGKTWTYHGGWKRGGKGREYVSESIRLPQDAETVSVEPKPAQQSLQDGVPTVRFHAIVDEEHELQFNIHYRLSKENAAAQTEPK